MSPYSILMAGILASEVSVVDENLRRLIHEDVDRIVGAVVRFLIRPGSPVAFLEFENELRHIVRELGRKVMEFACHQSEPEADEDAPHDVVYEAGGYRRLKKTPNRFVDTTFGRITLWRRGYRYWHRDANESTIFPLELVLGLVKGATPALAEEVGRMMAETGATQNRVLDQIRRRFGVSMSVKRLRKLVETVSESMERFRQHYQVRKLLMLLEKADASSGRSRPVLCVGRDGISLPVQGAGGYRQGATATVAVYDRRGKRLGTVYLASAPESGQGTLTSELTALIKECLEKWCIERGKPLPRLCYVTDAGDTECQYYRKVLSRMTDPRHAGRYLKWQRIIDYYHTTEKITIMAETLFGSGGKATAWAKKMRKLLLKPNGVSRVLHSAAAMKSRHGLAPQHAGDFERACNYIRRRSKHMRYAEFRKLRLPIGSGITEAACKTVFTQRLKLSGMGWKLAGAQVILDLRVILLSGIWDDVYQASVEDGNPVNLKPYVTVNSVTQQSAA